MGVGGGAGDRAGGQDIEQGVGGGGAGYRAGNGGRWGGGHVLDDMEQVVGVSSQLSVVGLVSVLGLICM